MKKRVLTAFMVVTVVGAALTGCGTASSGGQSLESVSVQTMAQSTDNVAMKATENVADEATKDERVADEAKNEVSVTDTRETVNKTEESQQTVVTTKERKADATEKKESAEEAEEPYFGQPGNIDNLKVTLGNSDIYTKKELQSAVDYILGTFQVDFVDCVMTELNYDEAFSLSQCQVWADQYDADEAVVFTCTFNTTENYREPNMEPGQICEGYNWILTRNAGGGWTLQTWGY